jgi:glyceraldehyde 3-phosphate dehydrogenase
MGIRIGINGFGRLGRTLARLATTYADLDLVAVADVAPAELLAGSLRHDTWYGRHVLPVEPVEDGFLCGGQLTRCIQPSSSDPAELPWGELGVDIVVEASGRFRQVDKLARHLEGGAKAVLLGAPVLPSHGVPTVIYGINHDLIWDVTPRILAAGGPTANALGPLCKLVHDHWGLEEGLATVMHAMGEDQSLMDVIHPRSSRLGRAGGHNLVPTGSGAGRSAFLAIPELMGRVRTISFRVPLPDVCCLTLALRTARSTSREEIASAAHLESGGALAGVLSLGDDELVSSDLRGDPHSVVLDMRASEQLNDRSFALVAWYDATWGFASRCVDLLRLMDESSRRSC